MGREAHERRRSAGRAWGPATPASAWGRALGLAALAVAVASAGSADAMRRETSVEAAERARREAVLRDPAASLRAAVEARAVGDDARALWLLGETARRHPIIGDYADLLRARLLLEAGQAAEAGRLLQEALRTHKETPLRVDFYELLGEARAANGKNAAARTAWRSAIDATRSESRRSALRLAIADSLERAGKPRSAASTYAKIWVSNPTRPEAGPAAERLDVLEEQLGGSFRSAADWRRRGDRLLRKRHNESALAAYDRALSLGLSGAEKRRALKQRAHTLFKMRRYPEAVAAFASLPQKNDVPLWHARSLARSGEVPRAVKEFEALGRKVRGPLGTRATYLAGLLLEGRGFDERAWRHFEQVAQRRSTPGLESAALWRMGWASYRGGRYAEAIAYFDRLRADKGSAIGNLRERYWRARALENLGDRAAEREFTTMALEFPFSYYGWRASERADRGAVPGSRPPLASGRRVLSARALARPRILLEAGLVDEAASELRRARNRADALSDRLEVAQLFTDAGDYHAAQGVVMGSYVETLARGPVASVEELWWHAWPTAYLDDVEAATRAQGSVEPALVLSIMREESGYRPKVRSPSGARGLLQIMPKTGEALATDLGQADFDAEQLFDPQANIRLGSHYLTQLSQRFDGRLSAAIASYNAGPDVVSEWLAERGELADDEWVESIPYDQTRSYVKRVLRSLRAYRVLY